MVAPWRMKLIREHLQAIADASHIVLVKFPLERILALLDDEHFDQPSPADENEAEVEAAVADGEPEFIFMVGWYVGEEWIAATGKSNCAVDALGELAGAIEQAKAKELERQRRSEARWAALEVAEDEKRERQLERLRDENQKQAAQVEVG